MAVSNNPRLAEFSNHTTRPARLHRLTAEVAESAELDSIELHRSAFSAVSAVWLFIEVGPSLAINAALRALAARASRSGRSSRFDARRPVLGRCRRGRT